MDQIDRRSGTGSPAIRAHSRISSTVVSSGLLDTGTLRDAAVKGHPIMKRSRRLQSPRCARSSAATTTPFVRCDRKRMNGDGVLQFFTD